MTDTATKQTGTSTTATGGGDGTVVLDRVTKRYGTVTAVDDLSLEVASGEFLSLLGPSGCGKTTTLRMLAGFEEPDLGDIRISGRSVVGVPPYKRNVNTVFQAYALFPHLSIAENVAYGLQQQKVKGAELRQRVGDALDMVRMRGFAERKPTQLSGGQQQRIALARALVNRPSVLLLDEPLGALDRQLREEMQLELKLLQSRLGISFIFVTHDQGEALSMSDRIAIMRDGRIEQLADASTIYANPASAYVAGFIGQQNFLSGTMRDTSTVDTAFGVILGTPKAGVAAGEPVTIAVRPEFVELQSATAGAPTAVNHVPGTILTVAHLGETVQFLIDLGHGTSIQSRRPTPTAPHLAAGDAVDCFWDADSVHLFPGEATPPVPDPAASADPSAAAPSAADTKE